MAGDWIKVRTRLLEDPAVFRMSDILGLSVEAVGGHLLRVWSWATDQVIDGNAPGVTRTHLDRIACVTGMGAALESVGWITFTDTGATFPNWERHLAQGAKARALTALRVQKSRNGAGVTEALPEKRREEKILNTPPSPQGDRVGESSTDPPKPTKRVKLLPDYTPEFVEFYKSYPSVRRQKKQVCWAIWQRDIEKHQEKDRAIAAVMEGLRRWCKCHQWNKDGGQFVCGSEVFLRQRRYMEDPPTAPRSEHE